MDDVFYETPDGKVYNLSELKKVNSFNTREGFRFKSKQQLDEWNHLIKYFSKILPKFVTKETDNPSIENFYNFFNQFSGNTIIYGRLDAYFTVRLANFNRLNVIPAHKTLFFYGSIENVLTELVKYVLYMELVSPEYKHKYEQEDSVATIDIDKFSITEINLPHLETDKDITACWYDQEIE